MSATDVAFWIPRKADELLGLNTNLELGIFLGMRIALTNNAHPTDPNLDQLHRQNLHVGWPKEAERMGLPSHYSRAAEIMVHSTLKDLCSAIAQAR